jgi:D-alanine-D-alanine ligase
MASEKNSVLVLFNYVEEKDEYIALRAVDPSTLDFTPQYNIHVATVQEEYDAIVNALINVGFDACCINLKDNFSILHHLITQNPPDVVFNLVEFFHNDLNNEGSVAGFFDLFRVPYTGSPPFCLSLCRRKALTKQVLLQSGIATPRFRNLKGPVIESDHDLNYPLIVKPARQDGSAGVDITSVVYDYPQLVRRIERVFSEFKAPILVEEFIEGKELHISVLGNNPPQVLPIIEFNFSELPTNHPHLITYDIKWNPLSPAYHKVHSFCPAAIDAKTEKLVKEQALRAFVATCCRDYARIDLRLGSDGVPYVLEVNPNPDLTEGVSFMESAEKAGLCFSETLRQIVSFALQRQS